MKDKTQTTEANGAVTLAQPKSKKKKVVVIVLVIVAIVVVLIGSAIHSMTQAVEMVANTIEVEPVQLRDLSDTISLKGSIAGASSVNVTSKAMAEITAMNVQVGDLVQAGDVLCTIDSAAIEEQLSELEVNVSNAEAVSDINSQQMQETLEQAKHDQQTQMAEVQKALEDAQGSYSWAEQQYNNGVIDYPTLHSAKRALESAETTYQNTLETTNRAIESAQRQIELNQYQDSDSATKDSLEELKEQLADCEVVAPCTGVVTSVNVRVGDINTEKATILTIEDTSSLKIVAGVDEADILKLQEGMTASVTADATGEEKINGTVSRVVRVKSQTAAVEGSAGGYSVEITIDNKDLLIGMAAKAKVMLKEKGEVLAVPYDLIQYDEEGNAFVLVAVGNEDGSATAVRKNVEVGEEVDYYTEITGGELAEGDMLIYDYTFSVMEGDTFAPEQMYSNQDLGNGSEMTEGENASAISVEVEVVE